jgi:predicted dithiol-disulfide oxidoreductase (DUF899 family)
LRVREKAHTHEGDAIAAARRRLPILSAAGLARNPFVGRRIGMMHIVCYLRQESRIFETYWTTIRGVEAMDNSYRLLDLTVYGRQEEWEDSPTAWLKGKNFTRSNGRPTSQWSRVKAGHSDELQSGEQRIFDSGKPVTIP